MNERYKIAYKGLGAGLHHFDFEIDSDFFGRHDGSEIKGGSAAVGVELERKSSMLSLRVHITGAVTVACDRCLEDCELPIDFRGKLIVKFSDEQIPSDGDVMWLSPAESLLDLEQYIYESIVLALPFRRVHPEDVHGTPLCNPAMLERFRIVTPEQFEHLTAEKPVGEDPRWAKLKELKTNEKE
jgi:uncharacterized metal-binding protein YceD (DUF177 family)